VDKNNTAKDFNEDLNLLLEIYLNKLSNEDMY